MVHVDDVMFCGDGLYWEHEFLPKLNEDYNISHSQLGDSGIEITFLKTKIKKTCVWIVAHSWNQSFEGHRTF